MPGRFFDPNVTPFWGFAGLIDRNCSL